MSSYKNNRDAIVFRGQFALERQSVEVRQPYVEHQAGRRVGFALAKNSPAEGNVSTLKPIDRTRLLSASRTDRSSSTINTTGRFGSSVDLIAGFNLLPVGTSASRPFARQRYASYLRPDAPAKTNHHSLWLTLLPVGFCAIQSHCLHSRQEGGRLHAKPLGCSINPFDLPV